MSTTKLEAAIAQLKLAQKVCAEQLTLAFPKGRKCHCFLSSKQRQPTVARVCNTYVGVRPYVTVELEQLGRGKQQPTIKRVEPDHVYLIL